MVVVVVALARQHGPAAASTPRHHAALHLVRGRATARVRVRVRVGVGVGVRGGVRVRLGPTLTLALTLALTHPARVARPSDVMADRHLGRVRAIELGSSGIRARARP